MVFASVISIDDILVVENKEPSFQEKLRRAIDAALEQNPTGFEAFGAPFPLLAV